MDRRKAKTRDAIFTAFSNLIKKKKFNHITVQNIIDEANVGRSTFYSHFETKDALLDALCQDIFTHIFSEDLKEEETHDFSLNENGLEEQITHILYHLRDNQRDIQGIFSSESGELFLRYFKVHLTDMFSKYLNHIRVDVPKEFLLNHLVGSFSETILWWLRRKMDKSPEEVSKYYMSVMPFQIH